MTKDMQAMMKTWRMGNVVEMPANMSRREMMMMEENKNLHSKIRKLTKAIPSYSRDVVKMAAEKARTK